MPRPNTNPATLRRLLQQELTLGKQLAVLAEAESEAIIGNDIGRLEEIQREQRHCLEQMAALEAARMAATRDLAGMLGLDAEPTLSGLLPRLSPREREALDRLRRHLLETQARLEELNARNRRLLEIALEYVRFSLELLTTAALQPARYGTNLASVATPAFYIDSKA